MSVQNDVRTERIELRVSVQEKQSLEESAQRCGEGLSSFIRRKALGDAPAEKRWEQAERKIEEEFGLAPPPYRCKYHPDFTATSPKAQCWCNRKVVPVG